MNWSWLPGWDSIESAGHWAHFWFWFGIACLFALALLRLCPTFTVLGKTNSRQLPAVLLKIKESAMQMQPKIGAKSKLMDCRETF